MVCVCRLTQFNSIKNPNYIHVYTENPRMEKATEKKEHKEEFYKHELVSMKRKHLTSCKDHGSKFNTISIFDQYLFI